jgi:hypothetical protein
VRLVAIKHRDVRAHTCFSSFSIRSSVRLASLFIFSSTVDFIRFISSPFAKGKDMEEVFLRSCYVVEKQRIYEREETYQVQLFR